MLGLVTRTGWIRDVCWPNLTDKNNRSPVSRIKTNIDLHDDKGDNSVLAFPG